MTSIHNLSLFTGNPAFREPLHVGRPNIGDRARLFERFDEILDRRWLTNNGPMVQRFEKRLAEYVDVRHCVAMCSGTIALEIAIRALELTGEVIIPSFTFIATANALRWQGITPVFCDINPHTHNIDPNRIESLITPRTSGIIGVHLWSRPCDVDALGQIARRNNLTLLYDAAHAFGCSYQGRMIGSFGAAEVMSFHATKFINSSEGGAVMTNDDELANRLRLMRNFGFAGYDEATYLGTNGKMSEMSAAMGLTALESVYQFVSVNRRNYRLYREELAQIAGLSLQQYDSTECCNYQYIVLEVDETLTGLKRDQIIEVLFADNVLARRYFYPGCHRMEPYRTDAFYDGVCLPVTEEVAKRVLLLPTGTSIETTDIKAVCQILRLAIMAAPQVRRALAKASPTLALRRQPRHDHIVMGEIAAEMHRVDI